MDFHTIEPHQTHDLRQKVLRPQQTIEEMVYPLDDLAGSFHLGAFENDQIVGIISVYPESVTGETGRGSWRIRGMAVESRLRGQGVGKKLIQKALERLQQVEGQEVEGQEVWCNARSTAIGFYTSLGFAIQGEEFEILGIGPHFIASYPLP